jgi:tetratricopeptide (TPR) repeat protein
MKASGILGGLAAAAFFAAAASPAWAQRPPKKPPQPAKKTPKDQVIYASGEAEGRILAESWKEIQVDVGGGRVEKIPSEEVELVIYADAPDAYRGALERIGADDYVNALLSLGSAKEWADDKKNKIGAWFEAYYNYYRGLCLAKQNKHVLAINEFKEYLSKFGPRYHMTRRALEHCFDSLMAAKDVERAKEIGAIPLPNEIKPLADLKRAEFLRAAGSPRDAIPICELLRTAADTNVRDRAVVLQVECLKDLKDQPNLERLCDEIIKTTTSRAALFVAKAALGDAALKAGQTVKAIGLLTEALVLHHAPGVGAAHEEALWNLANAYEKVAAAQSEVENKKRFLFMANGAYNELVMSHRKGARAGDAEKKAEAIDKTLADLEKGGGVGGTKD